MSKSDSLALAFVLDGENLLESESFYIPLPLSDLEQSQQTQSGVFSSTDVNDIPNWKIQIRTQTVKTGWKFGEQRRL